MRVSSCKFNLFIIFFCLPLLQGCLNGSESESEIPIYQGPLPYLKSKVDAFSSCQELTAWYQERQATLNHLTAVYSRSAVPTAVADGAASPASGGPGGPGSVTNIQVDGIDEPDLVKAFAGRLFFARRQAVEVFSARDLSPVTTLSFDGLSNLQLLQFANRLAVIGGEAPRGKPRGITGASA